MIIKNKEIKKEQEPIYQYDEATGFWGKPNIEREIIFNPSIDRLSWIKNNEYGNRDKPINKSSNSKNFICCGGSHTWGAYVDQDQRYSDLLTEWTSRRFFNIGHPSVGLDQICLAIMHKISDFNPDGILIEQYPWSFHRILNTYINGYLKPYFYLSSDGELKMNSLKFLARYKIYRKIVGEYRLYKKEFTEIKSGIDIKDSYDPAYDPVFLMWKASYYDYTYELFGRIALKIKEYCESKDLKLLFFLTAHLQQFFPNSGSEIVDYDLPTKKLVKVFEKYEIPYINMSQDLLCEQRNNNKVIVSDGHLNENGHKKVAEVLLEELKKREWL